ncbi:bile acid:sodium symporter family protein [Bacteroidota bacterium]
MANIFSAYFLPVTLAIITLGMGLSITLNDVKRVFFRPRAILIGIICQILLLPVIAFSIALLTDINSYFKVGLIIIAACPGGATSNLITYLLRGNVALSISMTALNSIITLISIPINVSIALMVFLNTETHINLNVWDTILKVFLLTIVPAYVGINIRHKWTDLADKLNRPLRIILPLILAVVYLGVLFIDEGAEPMTRMDFFSLLPLTLLLNIVSMFLGWWIGRLSRLKKRDSFTIAIEVGLQNSALAIFVAGSLLENRTMALVAVIYGSFSFFSTAFIAWGIKRIAK